MVIWKSGRQHLHWHCIFSFFFCLTILSCWKSRTFLWYLLWLVNRYHYHIAKIVYLYDLLFIDPRKKGCLNFRITNNSENFWKLASKTSMMKFLLSIVVDLPGSFPKNCLEQLFCREPVDACFCIKELHSRSRIFENF